MNSNIIPNYYGKAKLAMTNLSKAMQDVTEILDKMSSYIVQQTNLLKRPQNTV
jgi:hypothetical protein